MGEEAERFFGIGKERKLYELIEGRKLLLPNLSLEKKVDCFFGLNERPDYLFYDYEKGLFVYLEVKPWNLRIKDVLQVIKYFLHIQEHAQGRHGVAILCRDVDSRIRREILEKIGIRVYTYKDCIVSHGENVSEWMEVENEK